MNDRIVALRIFLTTILGKKKQQQPVKPVALLPFDPLNSLGVEPAKLQRGISPFPFPDLLEDLRDYAYNPCWAELSRYLINDKEIEYKRMDAQDRYPLQQRIIDTYTWSIPDPKSIKFVRTFIQTMGSTARVIEIGAGTGYWAWQLSQGGMHVMAYDCAVYENSWYEVRKGGPEILQYFDGQDDILFLCWPELDNGIATNCLKNFKGRRIIYIGHERFTGDKEFHAEVKEKWKLIAWRIKPSWYGVQDEIKVYDKIFEDDKRRNESDSAARGL